MAKCLGEKNLCNKINVPSTPAQLTHSPKTPLSTGAQIKLDQLKKMREKITNDTPKNDGTGGNQTKRKATVELQRSPAKIAKLDSPSHTVACIKRKGDNNTDQSNARKKLKLDD